MFFFSVSKNREPAEEVNSKTSRSIMCLESYMEELAIEKNTGAPGLAGGLGGGSAFRV